MKNGRTLTQLLLVESEAEQKAKKERLLLVLTDEEAADRKRISCRLSHGHNRCSKRSNAYTSWANMKTRCLNPNFSQRKDYAGRGITVCERWMVFSNFLEDMGDRPNGLTLERIDNNKGYFKENCCWATRKTQNNNSRHVKWVRINGVEMSREDASRILGVHRDTLRNRIKRGVISFDPLNIRKEPVSEEV